MGGLVRADIQLLATYLIAVLVLIGAFILIFTERGDSAQSWLAVGAILGYVFRDAGGEAATRSVERIQASQPTVQVSQGDTTATVARPGG